MKIAGGLWPKPDEVVRRGRREEGDTCLEVDGESFMEGAVPYPKPWPDKAGRTDPTLLCTCTYLIQPGRPHLEMPVTARAEKER